MSSPNSVRSRRVVIASALSLTGLAALCSLSSSALAQVTPATPTAPPVPAVSTPAGQPASGRRTVNGFTHTVLQNFDAWDTDHDGVLSEKEIDARLLDPNTTGDAAAAVGAIKIAMRSGKFALPPLTREYFVSYADYYKEHRAQRPTGGAAPEGTANPETAILPVSAIDSPKPDLAKPAAVTPETKSSAAALSTDFPRYLAGYQAAQRRIKATPKDVFASNTTLSLNSIHQGQIGDCYLLSVLGGMINRDASSIDKLVKLEPDGSTDVTLPDGMTTHVAPITDAEVAVSSGTAGTGRWLPVLEEAYGRFRIRMKSGATTDAPDEIGTDSATKGGSVSATMHNLTGHKVSSVHFRKRGKGQEMPSAEEVAPLLPSVRKGVGEALRDNRLVAAGTGTALPLPPAINGRHAYAIIKFDEASDMLTIWNPHNNNFTPKGAPGLDNGYATKGGVFQMPLVEFARVYPSISWELPGSAAATTTASAATATIGGTAPATAPAGRTATTR